MATVSRGLPDEPHLNVPIREASELLDLCQCGDAEALDRMRRRHPKFQDGTDAAVLAAGIELADAQLVIAREYGFSTWTALNERIAAHSAASGLEVAIRAGDRDGVAAILRANPEMLHLPVRSGNWGPPMSHAANLGRLEIIEACAQLGARDHQHAFDRAVLQGQIECARWLHAHGAKLVPGIVMGACETLNAAGFKFLLDLGAPLTDEHGSTLAPVAMVLETYGRNSRGKHEILDLLAESGHKFPDTPMMAFHRGDVAQLEMHLRLDPQLLDRRFALQDTYPPECGCATDGRAGMHWTPIDGTTLLHLAIDFREHEIFDWLLAHQVDVNAQAHIDREGFGGHTPLFNAAVCGPWPDATMVQKLLLRGGAKDARASLRKFLDWIENPRWHEARDVTAAEWGQHFPEKNWVNAEALRMLVV